MSQFIPGSTDPKSEKMAYKAIETFEYIANGAKKTENKKNAMIAIAGLYYNLKRADDSKKWCNKVLEVDPNSAEAYYRIAVVNYDASIEKTGTSGENVEFMSPEEKANTKAAIEEGLQCLAKAVEIQPNYIDAMDYQNYLWREKAKLETDETVKKQLIGKADELSLKVMKLQIKAKEEEAKKMKKLNIGK